MKRPMIKEGGTSRIFDRIKTLETPLQSSGSCIWVPEAETNLTTKNITKNGVYVAIDDGAYGYSSVIVNVKTVGGITGTGSDGKQHTISTDPSGNVVDSVAPVEIRVITPPTNPYGIYTNGQTISKDGMVVHSYDSSGADLGVVPNGEITLNPTTAVYDSSTDPGAEVSGDGVTASVLVQVVHTNPYVPTNKTSYYIGDPDSETSVRTSGDTTGITVYLTVYNGNVYGMIKGASSHSIGWQSPDTIGASTTLNNQTFVEMTDDQYIVALCPSSTADPIGKDVDDMEPIQAGSRQEITVSWPRQGDAVVLNTSFAIYVAPSPSGNID